VATGASGAADAETPPPRHWKEAKVGREELARARAVEIVPRSRRDGRHACCEGTTAFAGTKDMSPHYLLISHIFCSQFDSFQSGCRGLLPRKRMRPGMETWRGAAKSSTSTSTLLPLRLSAAGRSGACVGLQYTEKITSQEGARASLLW